MSDAPPAPDRAHAADPAPSPPRTLGSSTLEQVLTTLPFDVAAEATRPGGREPLALVILAEALAQDQRLRGLLRLEIARAGGLRQPGHRPAHRGR